VLVAGGLALMLMAGATSPWTIVLPGEMVVCIGTGLFNPAVVAIAIGSVPERQSGLAAGVNDAFRQGGVAVGVAAFGALMPGAAALGNGSPQAFVDGFHHAILAGAGVAAVGAVVAAWLLGVRRASRPVAMGEPVAELG
jgi:hypothetical protein